MRVTLPLIILGFFVAKGELFGESLHQVIQKYKKVAQTEIKDFTGFSSDRGKELYFRKLVSRKGEEISCSTCHTTNPKNFGRTHANKSIKPMAPVINPNRFTNFKHVEKWFKRNCDDVLRRPCNPLEKGDFLSYMAIIK